jgi:hypothetical protein
MEENQKEDAPDSVDLHIHLYEIIKGSAAETGIPKWQCSLCGKIVESN